MATVIEAFKYSALFLVLFSGCTKNPIIGKYDVKLGFESSEVIKNNPFFALAVSQMDFNCTYEFKENGTFTSTGSMGVLGGSGEGSYTYLGDKIIIKGDTLTLEPIHNGWKLFIDPEFQLILTRK